MGIEEIVGLVLIFLVVVIPVLGFTARIALRPIVQSVLELKDALFREGSVRSETARILALEEELDSLRRTVAQLQGAREWDRALREGEGPALDDETSDGARGGRGSQA